ncbi:MAG TPA: Uma2 family endonuclease [Actinocrinis sp.]|uniref:Uma2 family endonuclease n=1 Tax=Actinocrinis sp. TaxID=1920516 RepID=UPI002DDCA959|nr:Uma2 family endonuclease [Actinocrinis sp.]HEV3171967.1 Uma2 family endonuclease [Actinocrinis sp.]
MLERTMQARPRLLDLEVELPEGYKKVEIVEGALIMSPLLFVHNMTLHRLMTQLDEQLPPELLYVSDVLTPFPLEDHEFCPDLAVVPRRVAESNQSVTTPEVIEIVVEIISKGTGVVDYQVKTGVYARAGIPEYVIFDPYTRQATRYAQPEDGKYRINKVFDYGEAVQLDTRYPLVFSTAGLPVDPKR